MAPKRSSLAKPPSNKKQKASHQNQSHSENYIQADQELTFKNSEFFAAKASKKWKNQKQILDMPSSGIGPKGLEFFTYARLDAPPSLRPLLKYCDITGLEARYIDPRTGLRYHNSSVYQHIKTLGPETVQRILNLRNAGKII